MPIGPNPLDDQQRLDRYLGSIGSILSARFQVDEDVRGYLSHPEQSADDFIRSLDLYAAGRKWKQSIKERMTRQKFENYVVPIQDLYRDLGHAKPFLVVIHDNKRGFSIPTFTQSAAIPAWLSNRCILPINAERHWDFVTKVDGSDMSFQEKDDTLVWRGATTGLFRVRKGAQRHASRFHVARRWEELKTYDIGFSKIVQIDAHNSDIDRATIGTMLKEPLTIQEHLKSKYLLSLEGNDVASGLKWMLYSRSLVIMPHPTCESWYCEGFLQPFRHYVPVAHDLSDINEVYAWCRQNDRKCERIAMNGRAFVLSLMNQAREQDLARKVADAYASKVTLALTGAMKDVLK